MSMLVQEVDPRKALLTLHLELIESVTATDQEKSSALCIHLIETLVLYRVHHVQSYTIM